MKLGTNIYQGLCTISIDEKVRGQRSRVKVIERPNALLRPRHTFQLCDVEAHFYFYCATACNATHGIARPFRPSVRPSVCLSLFQTSGL